MSIRKRVVLMCLSVLAFLLIMFIMEPLVVFCFELAAVCVIAYMFINFALFIVGLFIPNKKANRKG